MELRFLGRPYSASTKQIPTVSSVQTACFRGQRYNLRVPVKTSNSKRNTPSLSASIRKYRGVAYIVSQQLPPIADKRQLCHR